MVFSKTSSMSSGIEKNIIAHVCKNGTKNPTYAFVLNPEYDNVLPKPTTKTLKLW
jgi:hypothetical protein